MALLSAVVVFIVDISGFTDSWKAALGRWLCVKVGRVRPFDCSLCCTWWACIVLLLCRGDLTLGNVAFAAVLAASSKIMAQVYHLALYAGETALKLINKLFDRLW